MMNEVKIVKVTSQREMDDFIHVVDDIYRDYPQYVPEFENDVRGLFPSRRIPDWNFQTSSHLLPIRTIRS